MDGGSLVSDGRHRAPSVVVQRVKSTHGEPRPHRECPAPTATAAHVGPNFQAQPRGTVDPAEEEHNNDLRRGSDGGIGIFQQCGDRNSCASDG